MSKMFQALAASLVALFLVVGCSTSGKPPQGESGNSELDLEEGRKGPAEISKTLAKVQSCMRDEGLVADYDGWGGLYGEPMTHEQGELWRDIYKECSDKTGYSSAWTGAQLKELYALEVENHNCLLEAGYDSEQPPSEQVYIESWGDDHRSPYQAISILFLNENAAAEYQEAIHLCVPPLWSFG